MARNREYPEYDPSEIECAHCGETFYYELTRCPNCGRSVYQPEEDDIDDEEIWGVDPERDSLEEWLAVLAPAASTFAGLFVSYLVATIAFLGFRFILGDATANFPGRALLLLSAPIGAAVGAFTAASLEKDNPRRIGWWVGGGSIVSAVVLAGVDADQVGSWFGVETIPIWALTVLAGAAGAEYWRRQQREIVLRQLFPDLPDENTLYADLLAKSGHDPERAERLIEFERTYMPNATRRTLIESAISRWERDNR